MLREALERFPAEVEPVETRIGSFEPGNEPDAVGVVIEPAGFRHRLLQRVLARVTEGRMAKIVGEAQRFGQVFVQPQRPGDRPPDLRDLDAVREADSIMVAVGSDEDLRLVPQPAEGHGVDDAIAIALEDVARPARCGVGFRMGPAARR